MHPPTAPEEEPVEQLKQAEGFLLEAAPAEQPRSSRDVIETARKRDTTIPADTFRFAYWALVSQGELLRTPTGVLRRREPSKAR